MANTGTSQVKLSLERKTITARSKLLKVYKSSVIQDQISTFSRSHH